MIYIVLFTPQECCEVCGSQISWRAVEELEVGPTPVILLMEEIQHHLGCINPYNGIFTISTGLPNFFHQQYEARWLDVGNAKPLRTFFGCSRLAQRVEIIHMSLEPGIRCYSVWRNIDV